MTLRSGLAATPSETFVAGGRCMVMQNWCVHGGLSNER